MNVVTARTTRRRAALAVKENGSANGSIDPGLDMGKVTEVKENVFLFVPNIIGG